MATERMTISWRHRWLPLARSAATATTAATLTTSHDDNQQRQHSTTTTAHDETAAMLTRQRRWSTLPHAIDENDSGGADEDVLAASSAGSRLLA